MTRAVRLLVLGVLALQLPFSTGTAGAASAQPIRPDQHFAGLVNGKHHDAVVYTVCAGPVSDGRTGPVAGGQTMSVNRVAGGHGFTGPFSVVYAWFVPAAASSPPTQLQFTTYRTPQDIPTSVAVPCGGTGRAEFSACPYLAPCAAGWIPTYVSVRFENIAV